MHGHMGPSLGVLKNDKIRLFCDSFVKSNKHIQLLPELYSALLSLTTV